MLNEAVRSESVIKIVFPRIADKTELTDIAPLISVSIPVTDVSNSSLNCGLHTISPATCTPSPLSTQSPPEPIVADLPTCKVSATLMFLATLILFELLFIL